MKIYKNMSGKKAERSEIEDGWQQELPGFGNTIIPAESPPPRRKQVVKVSSIDLDRADPAWWTMALLRGGSNKPTLYRPSPKPIEPQE